MNTNLQIKNRVQALKKEINQNSLLLFNVGYEIERYRKLNNQLIGLLNLIAYSNNLNDCQQAAIEGLALNRAYDEVTQEELNRAIENFSKELKK